MNALMQIADLLSLDSTFQPESLRTSIVASFRRDAPFINENATIQDVRIAFMTLSPLNDPLGHVSNVTLAGIDLDRTSLRIFLSMRELYTHMKGRMDIKQAINAAQTAREFIEMGGTFTDDFENDVF